MSKENGGNNVIGLNFPQIEEKSWWGWLSWHTKTQVFIALALLGPLPTAVISYSKNDFVRATVMWMISFFLMFIMWALEYRKRLDTDHIRGY